MTSINENILSERDVSSGNKGSTIYEERVRY